MGIHWVASGYRGKKDDVRHVIKQNARAASILFSEMSLGILHSISVPTNTLRKFLEVFTAVGREPSESAQTE